MTNCDPNIAETAVVRFTRLTNAFSKKIEMHAHAVAIQFMWYNVVKLPHTLRMTPAMAAGVTDLLWEAEDIMGVLDAAEAQQNGTKSVTKGVPDDG